MINQIFETVNKNKFMNDWKTIINETYNSLKNNIKELYISKNVIEDDNLKEVYIKNLLSLYHHLKSLNYIYCNNNKIKYSDTFYNQMNDDVVQLINLIRNFEVHIEVINDMTDLKIPTPLEIKVVFDLINEKTT